MMGKEYQDVVDKLVATGKYELVKVGGKHPNGIRHKASGRVVRFPSSPSDSQRGALNFRSQVEMIEKQFQAKHAPVERVVDFSVQVNFEFITTGSDDDVNRIKALIIKAVHETLKSHHALDNRIEKMMASAGMDTNSMISMK